MTQEYDNTDRGVLFKNDRKEQDSHPDYKGSVNVGGQEFWLSAWIKTSAKGKFMSLSVKPKDAPQPTQARSNQRPEPVRGTTDDLDVPF
jgi:hypothetical protein